MLCTVNREAVAAPSAFNVATTPVAGQSPADLHSALMDAFEKVLVKISGDANIMAVPGIQQQWPSVEKFVQKYSYLDGNLQVTFDRRALITLLVQAQQPVWLTARPSTLIWLSVNGQPPAAFIRDNPDPMIALLQSNAANRGIPVEFPVMDASDQMVWQAKIKGTPLDQTALENIAAHYQAPAITSIELNQEANQSWTATWFFVWRGQTWQWHSNGAQAAVLQTGMGKIADLMASQLATRLDQQVANTLWLVVLGVNDLADYAAVLHAVRQLSPVLGVFVQDVGRHGLLLQVTTVGEGADALKSALVASKHFTPAPAATPGEVLNYQWTPSS